MSKKMPVINLVDVNNLLYIGDHRFKNYSVSDVAGNKIKTGGMYMVLNLLRRKIYSHTGNLWIFCFDRQSHRRELGLSLGVDYKTGRAKMPPELYMQSEELFNWLPKMGYNAIGIDGLEADDIINSIVAKYKKLPVKINILSTDRDLSFNVSERCELVSSNMRVTSVTRENYESTVGKKGHFVEYNSILLYKVICGDSSDGIPPICKESYSVYRKVCTLLKKEGFELSELTEFDNVEKVLGILTPELKAKALINWELVKPFILDEEVIELSQQNIDLEEVYKFCSTFGMKSIAKKFGLELGDFTEEVKNYRLELYKKTVEKSLNSDFSEVQEDSPEDVIISSERIKIIDSLSNAVVQEELSKIINKDSDSVHELDETFQNQNQSITEDINQ